eukprot:m.250457 g.250457  ORF g.250457 m.250457 type:complete len:63 (+) comp40320_c0_seq39:1163-1351(+)
MSKIAGNEVHELIGGFQHSVRQIVLSEHFKTRSDNSTRLGPSHRLALRLRAIVLSELLLHGV